MRKLRLDIIGLSSSHSQIGHYALILGEHNGNRRLPIIIGGAEAQAIALELESIKTNRPMTHDLLTNIVRHFGVGLMEVVINDLHEGIFFARLVFEHQGEIHEIDSRPSDAIAIAVRFKAPIYAVEDVLDEAGILIDEENSSELTADDEETTDIEETFVADESEAIAEAAPAKGETATGDIAHRIERLRQKLDAALAREDYERAAQLRDEIQQLEDAA